MWNRQGLVHVAKNKWGWDFSHATHPVVDNFSHLDKWRIYFSTRDKNNLSHITFIEVEAGNPKNIIYENPNPILKLGNIGEFDEFGIMPTSIIKIENKIILYYIGFSVKKSVPFETLIGAAISYDGVDFKKIGGPIFGKDFYDPYFSGTLCAFLESDFIRGYYMSGIGWQKYNNRIEPKYNVKYAESKDGIIWQKKNSIAINLKNLEAGICQSSVIKNDKYRMWFCHRNMGEYRDLVSDSYRIGYAESNDGFSWDRKDNSPYCLLPSNDGWDSIMTCYPWVFEHKNQKWIFYNGNHFGGSGFGCAFWED